MIWSWCRKGLVVVEKWFGRGGDYVEKQWNSCAIKREVFIIAECK